MTTRNMTFVVASVTALLLGCMAQATERSVPPNVIVITAEELEKGVYGADLFDLLAALRVHAGITVKTSSDVGAEDWLLIRGIPRDSGRTVLVIVDGMAVNDAFSEAGGMDHLPGLDVIEKIIVYKPPLPPRFGGYTAVVEVFTKSSVSKTAAVAASLAYGEYDTLMGSLSIEGTVGSASAIAGLDMLKTKNLTGERRTPPKEEITYGDRSFKDRSGFAKLIYSFSDKARLSFSAQLSDTNKKFADEKFAGNRQFRDIRFSAFNLCFDSQPWKDARFSCNLFRADEEYELNIKFHPDLRLQERYRQGARLDFVAALPLNQTVSIGGEFTDIEAVEKIRDPLSLTDAQRFGVFFEDTVRFGDFACITVGGRFDDHSETKPEWSPYGSVSIFPFEGTSLFGIASRGIRWPALDEFEMPDPHWGLNCERFTSYEVGLVQQIIAERVSLGVSWFRMDIKRESGFVLDMESMPPSAYYSNFDDTLRSQGVEAEIRFNLTEQLDGFVNYTYNEVKRRPSGEWVEYAGPAQLANAGLTFTTHNWNFHLAGRYRGKAKGVQLKFGPVTELDDWFVLDAAASYHITRNLSVFARVGNIFDEDYETFDGRPMFGRVAVGGVSLEF